MTKKENLIQIINYFDSLSLTHFYKKIDYRKQEPQTIVDHIAHSLKYDRYVKFNNIKNGIGCSKYYFIQRKTGLTLEQLHKLGNFRKVVDLIEALEGLLGDVEGDEEQDVYIYRSQQWK